MLSCHFSLFFLYPQLFPLVHVVVRYYVFGNEGKGRADGLCGAHRHDGAGLSEAELLKRLAGHHGQLVQALGQHVHNGGLRDDVHQVSVGALPGGKAEQTMMRTQLEGGKKMENF